MIKRNASRGLNRQQYIEEDVDPMAQTSNITDAMLVLAVGIMLALVINWGVELNTLVDVDELEANDLKEEEVQEVEQNQSLQEKGIVYQDPNTGKYYIKVEE